MMFEFRIDQYITFHNPQFTNVFYHIYHLTREVRLSNEDDDSSVRTDFLSHTNYREYNNFIEATIYSPTLFPESHRQEAKFTLCPHTAQLSSAQVCSAARFPFQAFFQKKCKAHKCIPDLAVKGKVVYER